MVSRKIKEKSWPGDMWIISDGIYTDLDLNGIDEVMNTGFGKEYRISDLARYMLNPSPVEVEKTLVGCEVRYQRSSSQKARDRVRRILPKKLRGLLKDRNTPHKVLISQLERKMPTLKDGDLELYIRKIYESLKTYDSTLKELSRLDIDKISDVLGICEDIDGNRSLLALQGGIDKRINYIGNLISKDVKVILEKAHVASGLFEMGGFDFKTYNPKRSYRMIKFFKEGRIKCCVLDSHNNVEYWVDDTRLVHYIHLLEQSIRTNHKFADSLRQCKEGNAKPLKLFFHKRFQIDYSKTNLPAVYIEAFKTYNMGRNERDLVVNSLKKLQLGISFNYVPQSDSGEDKLFTNTCVMHDFRALEPIKNNLPLLYLEINKRASVSEAGKFYLLDSIREHKK